MMRFYMRSEIGKYNMGFNKRFVGKDNVLGVYDILYESKDKDAEIEVKKELNNKN